MMSFQLGVYGLELIRSLMIAKDSLALERSSHWRGFVVGRR